MKRTILIIGIVMTIILILNNKEELILIPNEAIRIRVIANSNSTEDLSAKEEIKEDLNKFVEKILIGADSIEQARNKIENNLDLITNFVDKKIKDMNYNMNYNISYGYNYFPKKEFKGVLYNEGLYESLVLTLGAGKGNNYWCVLYPPLCLINNEEKEYRLFIKDILDKYI